MDVREGIKEKFKRISGFLQSQPSLAQRLERMAVDVALILSVVFLDDKRPAVTMRSPVRIWGEGFF